MTELREVELAEDSGPEDGPGAYLNSSERPWTPDPDCIEVEPV